MLSKSNHINSFIFSNYNTLEIICAFGSCVSMQRSQPLSMPCTPYFAPYNAP